MIIVPERNISAYVFNIDERTDSIFGVVEERGRSCASCMLPMPLVPKIRDAAIGLKLGLRVRYEPRGLDVLDITSVEGPVSRDDLQRIFTFDMVYIDHVKSFGYKQGKRLFRAFGDTMEASPKRVMVYEGFFAGAAEGEEMTERKVVECVLVEPTDGEQGRGYTEYRGAFPRLLSEPNPF